MRCPACDKSARKGVRVLLLPKGERRVVCSTCAARGVTVCATVVAAQVVQRDRELGEFVSSLMQAFRAVEVHARAADLCAVRERRSGAAFDAPNGAAYYEGRAEGLRSAVETLKAEVSRARS